MNKFKKNAIYKVITFFLVLFLSLPNTPTNAYASDESVQNQQSWVALGLFAVTLYIVSVHILPKFFDKQEESKYQESTMPDETIGDWLFDQTLEKAEEYYDSGKYNECIKELSEIEKSHLTPEKAALAYNLRGSAYFALGKYQIGIIDFTNAIKNDPQEEIFYVNRGLSYGFLEEFEKAENDFSKAIELNPGYLRAYTNRGWYYLILKEFERAIKDYTKAIELKPDEALPYNQLAFLYNELGKYSDAIKNATKAIELKPEMAQPYTHLGYAYWKLNKNDEAEKYFSKSIELNPGYLRAFYYRGDFYRSIGKNKEALEDFNYFVCNFSSINQSLQEEKLEQVKLWIDQITQVSFPTNVSIGLHWAVIIGISEYEDSKIPPLRYASTDALAFNNWIVSPNGGKYAPAHVKLLLNENATYQNIRDALFVWLNQALEEDIVTIFFAGHGSPQSPDNIENLFFLTYDTDYDNIAATGFPMWDVETSLKRFIKAKKKIVISDACHSGGVGQAFDVARRDGRGIMMNPFNSRLQTLSQVGDGVCVISASDENQLSQEGQQWGEGHGIFTYFLLEGLKGNADYNKDNAVTLGELIPYLSETVRRETRNAQSPTIAGRFDPALSIAR